ncbi:MAG: FG-GAP-like repeat-containing protein, partial [Chloroflexi bacterium]|nr:FG-GAP-like repeat-containing protein [Chloroflexota bacterium]
LDVDLPADASDELLREIDESGIIPLDTRAVAVVAEARSQIAVRAGARIRADRDVFLDSNAVSTVEVTTRGRAAGLTFGSSSPTATVEVENGVFVNAGRNVDLRATTGNTLDIVTAVPAGGDVANVSVSFGKARSTSVADLQAGATVEAQNATVLAENVNSFSNVAVAGGFPPAGQAGVGATAAISFFQSEASATVAGNVRTTGNLVADARSRNVLNETRSFGAVSDAAGASAVLDAIREFVADIDLSAEVGDQTIDANGPAPDIVVGAAVTLVETENKAAALVDDGADLSVSGDLTVTSRAEENVQSSATASAGDGGRASVGGAVDWTRVANQATAFLGPNAIVDVSRAIHLDAAATVPNRAAPFDPTIDLSDTDTAQGIARIREEYDDGEAVGEAVSDAITPVRDYLATLLGSGGEGATTFVHAGGTVRPGVAAGVAGGVNVLDVYNQGAAGIASGAKVNQRLVLLPADQDVKVDAVGTIGTVNAAGLDSSLNFTGGGTGGRAGVGGFVGAVLYDNHAVATIDDLALVSAGRDVTLHSRTRNDVLAAAQAGGVGEEVGADGAVTFINIANESLAQVEDRARVRAARDVLVNAENDTLAVSTTDGRASGPNVGVGASASFTVIDDATRAIVGDAEPVGPLGTGGDLGSVVAGNDLRLDARSGQEVWTNSVSGADSPGAPRGTGGAQSHGPLDFGFGVSGDVAFNLVTADTEAFVRDVPDVSAGGELEIEARAAALLAASAGAVAFGNHLGIGGAFAHNGLQQTTRAFTQDATVEAGSLVVRADAAEQLLTFSDGGSRAPASASVAGSVNLNRLTNVTEAALRERTVAESGGDVLVEAHDVTNVVSVAGASSASTHGFLSAGAAVDLGFFDKSARAFVAGVADPLLTQRRASLQAAIGAESDLQRKAQLEAELAALDSEFEDELERAALGAARLQAAGDVQVLSTSDDKVLSVSASMAETTGTGEATRVYRNNRTAAPFAGVTGQDVTGDKDLTTAVALGDLDGDDHLDLVTGNFGQFNRRFLNDRTGNFDAGKEVGTDLLLYLTHPASQLLAGQAPDLAAPSGAQLINANLPDPTTSLALGDVDGDGDLDIVAGNLGQPSRLYHNDGRGNFFPGIDIGAVTVDVVVDAVLTQDNTSVEDLRTDIQLAVSFALIEKGLNTNEVRVGVDPTGNIVFTAPNHGLPLVDIAQAQVGLARQDVLKFLQTGNPDDLLKVILTDPLTFSLTLGDSDLTQSVALGDVDGDDDLDLITGNLNQPNRLYRNDGTGQFDLGSIIPDEARLTTSVTLDDVDGDGDLDLVVGNIDFDLAALVEQGLVAAQHLVDAARVELIELLDRTSVTLLDLVEETLLDRFDLDPSATIPIADLLQTEVADLDGLVRAGLVVLGDFLNVPLATNDLVNSGLATLEEIVARNLADGQGNVRLFDLINSGLVTLEQLIGKELIDLDDVELRNLTVGELLASGRAELRELIEKGLVELDDFLEDQLDVRELLDSGLVELQQLVDAGLVGETDFDLTRLDPRKLSGLPGGGPTRLYLNDGEGNFGPGRDVSPDKNPTRSVVLGDVDGDDDLDLVTGNAGTPNRLYLNVGAGNFGPGSNITNDIALTSSVLLGDVDGDDDRDLLVGNLGQPNRLYLNNGAGVFG